MGFALSWIAVRGKAPEAVLGDLGLRRTGEQEEVPESPVVCARLPTGWFVVVMNESADAFDGTIDAAGLSRGAEVVTCMVEEHVMVSAFSSWKDGKRALYVGHNAEAGARNLDVRGTLPPDMKQIVDVATRAQDEEDAGAASTDFFFDVPVDMAYRLTGFRQDLELDGGEQFDVLERAPGAGPTGRHWWNALFRKGR